MKEIIMLLVTLLGICTGFAQGPAGSSAYDSVKIVVHKQAKDSFLIKDRASVKLFPNPAKNRAELEVSGFEPGTIKLQIIDAGAKLVRDEQRLLVSGNENIVIMFALQPGIYFVLVKQREKLVKKKLVVQ